MSTDAWNMFAVMFFISTLVTSIMCLGFYNYGYYAGAYDINHNTGNFIPRVIAK